MVDIREKRKSKGMSAVAVAAHLGVSRETYRRYESNPAETMTVEQVRKVCDFIGIDPDEIFLSSSLS